MNKIPRHTHPEMILYEAIVSFVGFKVVVITLLKRVAVTGAFKFLALPKLA